MVASLTVTACRVTSVRAWRVRGLLIGRKFAAVLAPQVRASAAVEASRRREVGGIVASDNVIHLPHGGSDEASPSAVDEPALYSPGEWSHHASGGITQ
jgi:hypothetical protein